MAVFAKSGAGVVYREAEALRSMMMGAEVLIIDPENEYQKLADAVGGSYIRLSLNSQTRINPFDLPRVIDSDEADDALRANLVTLHGLFRLMLGGAQQTAGGVNMSALTPAEEADLDQALIDTYARVGITSDPLTTTRRRQSLLTFTTPSFTWCSGLSLAQRLRKYTTGTFAGIFSQQSNIDINNPMVVFNIRDLEDELRPVAMYIVLSHIWNITRTQQKKRMLIVDEAWQLMKYEDSANFSIQPRKSERVSTNSASQLFHRTLKTS